MSDPNGEESRNAARLLYLQRTARYAATDLCSNILKKLKSPRPQITILGDDFARLNTQYWEWLPKFKSENGIPLGQRILPPKVIALTSILLFVSEDRFFDIEGMNLGESHDDTFRLFFIRSMMEDALSIPATKHLDARESRDLLVTMRRHREIWPMSRDAWSAALCLYFDRIWTNHGRQMNSRLGRSKG